MYIRCIFEEECEIFQSEGLGDFIKNIRFKDNQNILRVIDSNQNPIGVYSLLDGICSLNKEDKNLYQEIQKNLQDPEVIYYPKIKTRL